jgi:hypothetical protein
LTAQRDSFVVRLSGKGPASQSSDETDSLSEVAAPLPLTNRRKDVLAGKNHPGVGSSSEQVYDKVQPIERLMEERKRGESIAAASNIASELQGVLKSLQARYFTVLTSFDVRSSIFFCRFVCKM